MLAPGGALFVYTHVRQQSVLAPLLRLIARVGVARSNGPGLADLTIEKLRKTDHLNPLMSRAHLDEVAAARRLHGGAVPVLHAAPVVDRREHPRAGGGARDGQTGARAARQDRRVSTVRRCARLGRRRSSGSRKRGIAYRALQAHHAGDHARRDAASGGCDRGRSSRCW